MFMRIRKFRDVCTEFYLKHNQNLPSSLKTYMYLLYKLVYIYMYIYIFDYNVPFWLRTTDLKALLTSVIEIF